MMILARKTSGNTRTAPVSRQARARLRPRRSLRDVALVCSQAVRPASQPASQMSLMFEAAEQRARAGRAMLAAGRRVRSLAGQLNGR